MIQAVSDQGAHAQQRAWRSAPDWRFDSSPHSAPALAARACRYSPEQDRALSRVAATQPWTRRIQDSIGDRPAAKVKDARTEFHATTQSLTQSVRAAHKSPGSAFRRSIGSARSELPRGPDETRRTPP